jgi:hypothetical protein
MKLFEDPRVDWVADLRIVDRDDSIAPGNHGRERDLGINFVLLGLACGRSSGVLDMTVAPGEYSLSLPRITAWRRVSGRVLVDGVPLSVRLYVQRQILVCNAHLHVGCLLALRVAETVGSVT